MMICGVQVMREYDLLASQQNPSKKKLIEKLIPLARKAYDFLEQPGKSRWKDYDKLWNTKAWKEARSLLKQFFTTNGKVYCNACNREITGSFTLHHPKYPPKHKTYLLFHPDYCSITHRGCHPETIKKRARKK